MYICMYKRPTSLTCPKARHNESGVISIKINLLKIITGLSHIITGTLRVELWLLVIIIYPFVHPFTFRERNINYSKTRTQLPP
jgi:hypothetical protein